jgi:hypothetical protein
MEFSEQNAGSSSGKQAGAIVPNTAVSRAKSGRAMYLQTVSGSRQRLQGQ